MGQKKKFIEFIKNQGCHSSGAMKFIWEHFGDKKYPESYVEVGVKYGSNVLRMRSFWKATKFYLVDPWQPYRLEPHRDRNDMIYKSVFKLFRDDIYTNVLREYSVNGAKILDEKYDIVFIDGDHSYKEVMKDIEAWYPRVKEGGILCGHDYSPGHPDVKKGVDKCFPDSHIFTGKGAGDVWFHIKAKKNVDDMRGVIRMVASKGQYHLAAVKAGSTFRKFLGKDVSIQMYVPKGEQIYERHTWDMNRNDVQLKFFDFYNNAKLRYATQLKPQGYLKIIDDLAENEIAMILDSDTFCIRKFELPPKLLQRVMEGDILMVKEPWNRYDSLHGDKKRPDYIPPEKRLEYVNSGVIVASKDSRDMFEKFEELSRMPEFSMGPLHDQTIINYALCHFFPSRIAYLDKEWNGVCTTDPETTIIGHNGQGVGVGYGRGKRHFSVCEAILKDKDWFTVFKGFDKKK